MTHPLQERLVRELLAQDSSLRGREKELRALVQQLLEDDPVEKPSPGFTTMLREELRERAEVLAAPPGRRWLLSLSMALTGTAAATALLVLFLPDVREALTRSQQGSPATQPVYFEQEVRNDDPTISRPAGQMDGSMGSSATNAADTFQEQPDTPSTKSLLAPEATSPEPSMMMKMRIAVPDVTFPETLSVPPNLPTTARLQEPGRPERQVNVSGFSIDAIKQKITDTVHADLPPGTEIRSIIVGAPKLKLRWVTSQDAPGRIEVPVWIFTDVTVNGTAFGKTVAVPLQHLSHEE